MQPADLYDLASVSDPKVSPSGSTVAFVVTTLDRDENSYRSTIWIVPADGSGAARQFTFGPNRDGAPQWSPDGKWLAFTSARDSGAMQLHVIPVDGGEARRLTDLKASVDEVAWAPDSTRLVVSSRVPDPAYEESDDRRRLPRRFTRLQHKRDVEGWIGDRRRHLFVVAVDGSDDVVQLTDGDFEDASPAWSPDGTRIAFTSGRHADWDIRPADDIYLISTAGGEPERLTATDGSCMFPTWSPDGTSLAYLYYPGILDDPRHSQVAVTHVATGERRVLTESLDRNCLPFGLAQGPIWSEERLLFGVEDRGNTHIYEVSSMGDGLPKVVLDGELRVAGFDAVGSTLVHIRSTTAEPPDLYSRGHRLTHFGEAFASGRALQPAERFTGRSKDGTEVDAWIMRPAGFQDGMQYPTLLNMHGGPFTQYGNSFFDEFQVLTGAGYVVVFSNPRGSSGYTEAWGRAIRGPSAGGAGYGTLDYEDVMGVMDEALQRFDFIDPNRLGVMGGSYGGFLTSWIVGHTDRFQAACSERAANNWFSFYGSSDGGWQVRGQLGSYAYEDPETWLKHSPTTHAENIHTPLLIVHSEDDLRAPIEQAEHLFTTLRLLRRDVEFLRFPAENHELSRSGSPFHRVVRFEAILDWFARFLGPSPSSADATYQSGLQGRK